MSSASLKGRLWGRGLNSDLEEELSTSGLFSEDGEIQLINTLGEVKGTIPFYLIELFTLDTFGGLALEHWKAGKGFIIARTTYRDKEDPSKTNCSYYSAHHINKMLFRITPDEEIVHRYLTQQYLPAPINPATNTEIVGEVEYFILKPNSEAFGDIRLRAKSATANKHSRATTPIIRAYRSSDEFQQVDPPNFFRDPNEFIRAPRASSLTSERPPRACFPGARK